VFNEGRGFNTQVHQIGATMSLGRLFYFSSAISQNVLITARLKICTTRRLRCLGSSQWPMIKDGSIVDIEPIPSSAVRSGDLVVFLAQNFQICHRVIRRKFVEGKYLFLLKGDSQIFVDGWILEQALVGKVVRINGRPADTLAMKMLSLILLCLSRVQWGLLARFCRR
jgi:signal peptidase I